MAIKKPGSRFSDRNKIRRMHAEGYSVEQIANTVSIVPEHVTYVIEEWDAAEEKGREVERQKAIDAEEAARKAAQPVNPKPSIDEEERQRIRELARRELMEELAREQKTAKSAEAPETEEPAASDKPQRRRRQKDAA